MNAKRLMESSPFTYIVLVLLVIAVSGTVIATVNATSQSPQPPNVDLPQQVMVVTREVDRLITQVVRETVTVDHYIYATTMATVVVVPDWCVAPTTTPTMTATATPLISYTQPAATKEHIAPTPARTQIRPTEKPVRPTNQPTNEPPQPTVKPPEPTSEPPQPTIKPPQPTNQPTAQPRPTDRPPRPTGQPTAQPKVKCNNGYGNGPDLACKTHGVGANQDNNNRKNK